MSSTMSQTLRYGLLFSSDKLLIVLVKGGSRRVDADSSPRTCLA